MPPNEDEASEDSGEAVQSLIPPADSGSAPLKKKTISCTQCRRRKLKCDRVKPSCGTCSRLRHQCLYPEGRMKSTTKRRNVKDLEARLAQVESLLNSETSSKSPLNNASLSAKPDASSSMNPLPFWDGDSMDMGLGAGANNLNPSMHNMSLPFLNDASFSYDLIGCGLEEQLPPQQLIDDLHNAYFERIHPTLPLLHKYRYLATVNLPPSLGPPVCLRYAVWAIAASAAGLYADYQDVFYRRARKYAELDEMKGQGEHFLSVTHAQAWCLISSYEAENMCLSRAWVSAGRSIRMVQMMNLHRLDDDTHAQKQMIPLPRDWLELEERRRTFWAAFCCDRYSCAGSGWPMAIEERDILTNLPSSEEAFEMGEIEATISLSEAMTAEGASKVSPYGGQVLMASLFGHNWAHLHRPGPNDNPQDPLNGKFWRRHRSMDNMISNLSMFLPDHLRLPGNIRDSIVVCLNMNIHTTTICLHQVAIMKAEKYKLDAAIIAQSQTRCRAAAEEIVNIMRLISHFDIAQMNTWMSFNLYVASGVLIEGCQSPETGQHCRNSLEFLLSALSAMGSKRPVSKSFLAQLKIDLDAAGITSWLGRTIGEDINAMENHAESIDPPFIYNPRSIRSRIVELPFEMLNPSAARSSNFRSGTDSTATSTKESASPPVDLRNFHTMEGILPKTNLNMRIRRKVDGWNASGDASPGMNFMPDSGGEPAHHIYNTDPAANASKLGLQVPYAYRQEFLKSTTATYERHSTSEILNEGGKNVKVAPDFDYNSFILEENSGFHFPLQDGQDLGSFSWGDSLFNKR